MLTMEQHLLFLHEHGVISKESAIAYANDASIAERLGQNVVPIFFFRPQMNAYALRKFSMISVFGAFMIAGVGLLVFTKFGQKQS